MIRNKSKNFEFLFFIRLVYLVEFTEEAGLIGLGIGVAVVGLDVHVLAGGKDAWKDTTRRII